MAAGSPTVMVNSLPVARQDDKGVSAPCCMQNNFTVSKGSGTVNVNGKPAARSGDATKHCGGDGTIQNGSPTVNIGG